MMTPEQSASILARMFGYSGPTDQRSIDQFLAANPAAASRMGKYQETMKQMVSGQPIRGFQTGGLTTAQLMSNERRLEAEKSSNTNEFNLGLAKEANAKAAGSSNVPIEPQALQGFSLPTAGEVDQGFFESPEFKNFQETSTGIGTQDMYNSPFFGQMTSGSIGSAQDKAYIEYLKRTNPNSPQIPTRGPQAQISDAQRKALLDQLSPELFNQQISQLQQGSGQSSLSQLQSQPGAPEVPATPEEAMQRLQEGQQQLALQASQPLQQAVINQMETAPGLITPGVGQAGPASTIPTATVSTAAQATPAIPTPASLMEAATAAPQVQAATAALQPAQGQVAPEAQVQAAQGQISDEAMASAAQYDPTYLDRVTAANLPVTNEQLVVAQGQDAIAPAAKIAQSAGIEPAVAQQGVVSQNELPNAAQIAEANMAQAQAVVSGGRLSQDATAVAARLDSFNVDNGTLAEAVQGNVNAQDTVQGQLAQLMKQFDDGTPAWAAGAIRAANAAMASRGLGGSSMASAAILQAAMESALPIAAADAQTFAEMNMSNLNRRQQVALTNAAAQQGLSLQNLNNEQQAALQNSTNAFQLQSQDLSNMQQTVIANAQIKAALQGQNLNNQQQANLATAARYAEVANMNLNNRQQTSLQNNMNTLQVELQNLSNRQQGYIANAQLEAALQGKQIDNRQQAAIANAARFSEAANIQFSAEQQTALHNSQLMSTIGLADLNARQSATLQNAATLANMDVANLNNRQQAAVQNAQAFLQMDLTNLSNQQQTELFKTQQNVQALFTDQAARNAAAQFNASSENQTEQFFQSLASQTSQFNAVQTNALNQFNAGQTNAVAQFNAELRQQRDLFNAQNSLIVEQANAQWRQNVTTINTAAQNEANMEFAKTVNALSSASLAQIWQRERDIMSYSFTAQQSGLDRQLSILLADKDMQAVREQIDSKESTYKSAFMTDLLFGGGGKDSGSIFDIF
jgi:hypothetical protein